jgi:hypothetical protein
MSRRPFLSRRQKGTILEGINLIVILLVLLQLWLLTATMNAFLGGDSSVVQPAAIASLIFLGLNVGLLRYVFVLQRSGR